MNFAPWPLNLISAFIGFFLGAFAFLLIIATGGEIIMNKKVRFVVILLVIANIFYWLGRERGSRLGKSVKPVISEDWREAGDQCIKDFRALWR